MQVHWRALLGAVMGIAIVSGGVVLYRQNQASTVEESASHVSPEEVLRAWELGVKGAVQGYEQDKNALKARDLLLALRVPAEKREQHLSLVLALEAAIQQRKDAESRWQRAVEPFSGL